MGMKILLASTLGYNCDEAKKIKYNDISAEELEEMLEQVKEHWNDPLPMFCDYPSMLVSPIDRAPLRNADQLLRYEKR